jgi:hypothetical protein
MAYVWSDQKMACVATYKILEGEEFLDQFEDADIPFEDAAEVEMKRLRYYPRTTRNASILRLLSLQMAQRFYTDLTKTFIVSKERPERFVSATITALAGIFGKPNGTIVQLAEVVDNDLRFPGEQQ